MLNISRQHLLRLSRPTATWSRPSLRYAHANSETRRPPGSEEDPKEERDDFRPPWVYSLSRFGSVAVLPGAAIWMIFLHDWGTHEHVFMPPRRWLARLKQSFFTLSPEEERMLNTEIVEQKVERLPPIPPLPKPTSDKWN